MDAKHTPGPWQLEGNWKGSGELGGWVSTLIPSPLFELNPVLGHRDEIIANARLIAAAPDLLEVVCMALAVSEALDAECREAGVSDEPSPLTLRARAAIAKAEGE